MVDLVSAALGGAKILSGIFGRKSEKRAAARARAQQLEDGRQQFVRLRESAELGGFNPLTALMGGGLGGVTGLSSGTISPLASIEMISNGIQDVGFQFTDRAAIEAQKARAELDLAKIQMDNLKAKAKTAPTLRRAASNPPPRREMLSRPSLKAKASDANFSDPSRTGRPPKSPWSKSAELVPVIYPDGVRTTITKGHADALKIKPWDQMNVGHLEELVGDTTSDIESAVRNPDIRTYMHTGVVSPEGTPWITKDKESGKLHWPLSDPDSDNWWFRPIGTPKRNRKQ